MTQHNSQESAAVASTQCVYVVDDDEAMRDSMVWLIESEGYPVRAFPSAEDFLAAYTDGLAGCLVLDVRMPGMSGLDLQREMGGWPRQPPIVFITGHGDIPMTVRAIKAGAVEFLPKPFRDQDLLDAIQAGLSLDRAALRKEADLAGLRTRFDTLTQREREVLALLVQGLRNKQAADRLGISEVTVKVHRHNLMEKMRATSVPALLHMVNQLGA